MFVPYQGSRFVPLREGGRDGCIGLLWLEFVGRDEGRDFSRTRMSALKNDRVLAEGLSCRRGLTHLEQLSKN